jgi:hypothetical protein
MEFTPQEREYIETLKHFSNEQLRFQLEHRQLHPGYMNAVARYLSERERAASAEQTDIARRAADAADRQATAAERADRKATIAIVISIVAIVVSALVAWMGH